MKLVSTGGRGPVLALLALSILLLFCASSSVFACATLPYCYAAVGMPPEYLPGCEGHDPVLTGACQPAMACCGAAEGCYIQAVELRVAGTVVNRYDNPGNDRFRTYKITGVWSTTHFADESTVWVTAKVWDSGGHYATDVGYAKVVNKAYVAGNDISYCGSLPYGELTAYWVNCELEGMNFDTGGYHVWDTEAVIVWQRIPNYTLFYISSHGTGCDYFGSCCASSQGPPNEYINCGQVSEALMNWLPCQIPGPGPQFVYLDCCCTATYPAECGCGGQAADACCDMKDCFKTSAFLGFKGEILASYNNAQFSRYVFYYLRQGQTLDSAVATARAEWKPDSCEPGDELASPFICGNDQFTLTTVCGGQPGDWHRPGGGEGDPS